MKLNKIINFSGVYLALAEQTRGGIDSGFFRNIGNLFGASAGSPAASQNLGEVITAIVQILLIVAASIAVIFLIIGGYRYVVAHGNEEATEAAKKTITSAIWGLVIIVMAFAIISIIANVLLGGGPGFGTGIQ